MSCSFSYRSTVAEAVIATSSRYILPVRISGSVSPYAMNTSLMYCGFAAAAFSVATGEFMSIALAIVADNSILVILCFITTLPFGMNVEFVSTFVLIILYHIKFGLSFTALVKQERSCPQKGRILCCTIISLLASIYHIVLLRCSSPDL